MTFILKQDKQKSCSISCLNTFGWYLCQRCAVWHVKRDFQCSCIRPHRCSQRKGLKKHRDTQGEDYLNKTQIQPEKQTPYVNICLRIKSFLRRITYQALDPLEVRTITVCALKGSGSTCDQNLKHINSVFPCSWQQRKNNVLATTESQYLDDSLATTLGHNKKLWLPRSAVSHKGWNFSQPWLELRRVANASLCIAVGMGRARGRK